MAGVHTFGASTIALLLYQILGLSCNIHKQACKASEDCAPYSSQHSKCQYIHSARALYSTSGPSIPIASD